VKADLIRIGNSQGVRIPKALIDQCGLGKRVEMRVEGDSLIISRVKAARSGWDEAFNAMAEQGDDAPLLLDDLEHGFDQAEWECDQAESARGLARHARSEARLGDL
jgi:antitoxin MazE